MAIIVDTGPFFLIHIDALEKRHYGIWKYEIGFLYENNVCIPTLTQQTPDSSFIQKFVDLHSLPVLSSLGYKRKLALLILEVISSVPCDGPSSNMYTSFLKAYMGPRISSEMRHAWKCLEKLIVFLHCYIPVEFLEPKTQNRLEGGFWDTFRVRQFGLAVKTRLSPSLYYHIECSQTTAEYTFASEFSRVKCSNTVSLMTLPFLEYRSLFSTNPIRQCTKACFDLTQSIPFKVFDHDYPTATKKLKDNVTAYIKRWVHNMTHATHSGVFPQSICITILRNTVYVLTEMSKRAHRTVMLAHSDTAYTIITVIQAIAVTIDSYICNKRL